MPKVYSEKEREYIKQRLKEEAELSGLNHSSQTKKEIKYNF